jgi:hypothetical protein
MCIFLARLRPADARILKTGRRAEVTRPPSLTEPPDTGRSRGWEAVYPSPTTFPSLPKERHLMAKKSKIPFQGVAGAVWSLVVRGFGSGVRVHGKQDHDTTKPDRELRHLRRLQPPKKSSARRLGEAGTPQPVGSDQSADRTAAGPAEPVTASALITGTTRYAELPDWLRVSELAAWWRVATRGTPTGRAPQRGPHVGGDRVSGDRGDRELGTCSYRRVVSVRVRVVGTLGPIVGTGIQTGRLAGSRPCGGSAGLTTLRA